MGLEPTTYGLKVRYSAIELAPLGAKRSQLGGPLGNEMRTARQRREAAEGVVGWRRGTVLWNGLAAHNGSRQCTADEGGSEGDGGWAGWVRRRLGPVAQSFCRGCHPSRMLYESPTDGRPGETGSLRELGPIV